jgi:hypothetical protein
LRFETWIRNLIKPALQSKFTLLKSKFFPAKIPFSKIQKKNLAGKNYFAKEKGQFLIGVFISL